MKQGQTSVRGGVQDLLCPVRKLYITQGANEGSHKGIEAIDTTDGVAGVKAPYYAPCDLKVVQIYNASSTVLWQSIKPVRLANGKVTNVTIVTAHDETINFGVGFTIKQGLQMGNMGAKGIGTGVHLHIEQGYGHQFTFDKTGGRFTLGGVTYDIYGLKQQIPFEQAYFMDGTEIISGTAKWKYLKDVPVTSTPTPTSKTGTWEFKVDTPVRIRDAKTNAVIEGVEYKTGDTVVYDKTYEKDGYTWAEYTGGSGKRRKVAIAKGDKPWGKPYNQKNTPQKENLYEGKFKVGQKIEFSTRYYSHHQDAIIESGKLVGYIIHIYPEDKYPLAVSNTKGGKQNGATKPVNVYRVIG